MNRILTRSALTVALLSSAIAVSAAEQARRYELERADAGFRLALRADRRGLGSRFFDFGHRLIFGENGEHRRVCHLDDSSGSERLLTL